MDGAPKDCDDPHTQEMVLRAHEELSGRRNTKTGVRDAPYRPLRLTLRKMKSGRQGERARVALVDPAGEFSVDPAHRLSSAGKYLYRQVATSHGVLWLFEATPDGSASTLDRLLILEQLVALIEAGGSPQLDLPVAICLSKIDCLSEQRRRAALANPDPGTARSSWRDVADVVRSRVPDASLLCRLVSRRRAGQGSPDWAERSARLAGAAACAPCSHGPRGRDAGASVRAHEAVGAGSRTWHGGGCRDRWRHVRGASAANPTRCERLARRVQLRMPWNRLRLTSMCRRQDREPRRQRRPNTPRRSSAPRRSTTPPRESGGGVARASARLRRRSTCGRNATACVPHSRKAWRSSATASPASRGFRRAYVHASRVIEHGGAGSREYMPERLLRARACLVGQLGCPATAVSEGPDLGAGLRRCCAAARGDASARTGRRMTLTIALVLSVW
jgi:hypothetical protein